MTEETFIRDLTEEEAKGILRSSMSLLTGDRSVEAVKNAFRECMEAVGAGAGYIALPSPDGPGYKVILCDPDHGDDESPVVMISPDDIPEGIDDVAMIARNGPENIPGLPCQGGIGQEDVLFIPMRRDGVDMGLMVLCNKDGGFTERDVGLGTRFGGMAAAITEDCRNRKLSEKAPSERETRLTARKLDLMGRTTRHDVLNQIMVIQGFLEISYDMGQPLDEKRYGRITEAIGRIKLLYDLQRQFEALGSEELTWCSVREAAEASVASLKDSLSGIDVSVDADQLLMADSLLEKVFLDLMRNTAEHGRDVSFLRISSEESGGGLTISIEDDGGGINEEEKEAVFKLGFGKGNGHGLFLAREILETYDMRIEECGEAGKGSLFRITVPPHR